MVDLRQTGNPWVPLIWRSPHVRMRLFAFSYAGGSAAIYSPWGETLGSVVEFCPVQIPGHGMRLGELAISPMEALVPPLVQALTPYLDAPFAFWGHSMGALIAYAAARHLRQIGGPSPGHLFFAGSRAPHRRECSEMRHTLPEPAFLDALRKLKGPGVEALDHPELMALLMPTLRADFEIVDTYQCAPDDPLPIPVSAYGAVDDPDVDVAALEAWQAHTTSALTLRLFSGGHFFIHSAAASVLDTLKTELTRVCGHASVAG